jgi:hypothetical protein
MAIPKIQGAQRDFSAGELDVSMKRADDNPIMKAGARQLSNWRIRNSKSVTNRPGRSALFIETGRVEEVLMSPGNTFFLVFGNGYLSVYNAAGTRVFTSTKLGDGTTTIPWTTATIGKIVWDVYLLAIYICYGDGAPANVPQILTWDGVSQSSTWTLTTFAELLEGGQKRTPFYRISPQSITLAPSAQSGAGITLTASSALFVAGHIGTRIRFAGVQVLITAVGSSTSATATVEEPQLPNLLNLSFSGTDPFAVGDIVVGATSGSQCIVVETSPTFLVLVLNQKNLIGTELMVGAHGSVTLASGNIVAYGGNPFAVAIWDDEVMNAYRGYPTSIFVDQGRLGFCNFPSVPTFIAWSAIGVLNDQYTDQFNVSPDNAIQEIVPRKSKVLFVVAGPESSEFVFCDNGVYYIPISAANPLKPGSVAFNLLTADGCATVQPRIIQEVIVWINAGLTSVLAVTAPGAYYRPYQVVNISEYHAHLFNSPVAIAAPATTAQFEERYVYVLNTDGTVAVGKYNAKDGQIAGVVGWLPWSGAGTVEWVSALGSDVIFTTNYAIAGAATVSMVEKLDATQYLDSAISYNSVPTGIVTPGGKGPLWWLASGSVTLMDNVTRMMGTYLIDANGFIIPQNNGGENLASAALVAGQPWTATLEPFVPDAQPGQSVHQRMFKRRVSRMAVYVVNSSGFLMARLFSGPITRTSPALGTIMNSYRVTTWNQDDDPTQPPPLREEVQRWRPIGRSFDPRVAIIKDTPGPIEIPEQGIEASI